MKDQRTAVWGRRRFLAESAGAAAALTFARTGGGGLFARSTAAAGVSLPPLPYAQGALAPVISENTISFHYGKHHLAYVNNTNKLIAGTDLENASLEEIVRKSAGRPERSALFNNAAQVYNHNFYWDSMSPAGGGEPKGRIAEMLRESFGSYAKFVEAFADAAATQFGSGWAWLVQEGGRLRVIKTANADTPITMGLRPLVTIDVWEHAYYLDYQNRRADYIRAFIDKLLNWSFAEKNLA
jgi:Fe-Mn family superoxide dismutase